MRRIGFGAVALSCHSRPVSSSLPRGWDCIRLAGYGHYHHMAVNLSYVRSIGLVTGVLLLTSACRDSSLTGRGDVDGGAERVVEIIPVSERKIERAIVVFGSFRARERATLSAKVSGRLQSISVDLGSAIVAGGISCPVFGNEGPTVGLNDKVYPRGTVLGVVSMELSLLLYLFILMT